MLIVKATILAGGLLLPLFSQAMSCVKSGCSGQLCVDSTQAPVMTTCEYKEYYACYKNTSCEVQQNGNCGWTKTPAYLDCLQKLKANNVEQTVNK
jgi:eight-cysteine-cluster-containing protein